jgi:hypothetical protein
MRKWLLDDVLSDRECHNLEPDIWDVDWKALLSQKIITEKSFTPSRTDFYVHGEVQLQQLERTWGSHKILRSEHKITFILY